MTAARDLAATVRALRLLQDDMVDEGWGQESAGYQLISEVCGLLPALEPEETLRTGINFDALGLMEQKIAALERQAADAQAQLLDIRRQMEDARNDGNWPLAAVVARAVRAEEALRRAHRYGTTEPDAETAVVLILAALAAAGADTE